MALIHRLIDLGEASVREWSGANTLSGVVAVRAFFETVAITHWLCQRTTSFVLDGSISELDELVMKTSFGLRDPAALDEYALSATNVLTMINALDKTIEGSRDHYDRLSDVVHPNSFGHHQFYAQINYENGDVAFSKSGRSRRDVLPQMSASLVLGSWAVKKMTDLESSIIEIASLQTSQNGPAR